MEDRQLAIGDLVRSCMYGIPLCLLLTYLLTYLTYLTLHAHFHDFGPKWMPLRKEKQAIVDR